MRTEWYGDDVRNRVLAGTKAGMEQLDEAIAEAARHDHPGWVTRTGEAESSLAAVPVTANGERLEAGVQFGIARGAFLEFTTRGHPGDRTIARALERLSRDLTRRIAAGLR